MLCFIAALTAMTGLSVTYNLAQGVFCHQEITRLFFFAVTCHLLQDEILLRIFLNEAKIYFEFVLALVLAFLICHLGFK